MSPDLVHWEEVAIALYSEYNFFTEHREDIRMKTTIGEECGVAALLLMTMAFL